MVLCMTGSSATTMWGITELPACVIQQIQPCSTLIIDSYSFLRMPSIHCNLILNLSSDWFTSFNTIHNDQKCFYLMAVTTKISKMKAPGWRWRHLHMEGGRRIVLQWDRGCDIILFQPYTFSARTDVSTRASGLIIVPRRKGVCTCVSDCFRASLVSMPMSWTWFFLFCQVLFVWNLESWSRTLLRKSVMIWVLWLKQNSDSSVNLPCVCAADSCANVCCIWVQPKRSNKSE